MLYVDTKTDMTAFEYVWNTFDEGAASSQLLVNLIGSSDLGSKIPVEMRYWVDVCTKHVHGKVLNFVTKQQPVATVVDALGQATMRSTFAVQANAGSILVVDTEELFSERLRNLQTQRVDSY